MKKELIKQWFPKKESEKTVSLYSLTRRFKENMKTLIKKKITLSMFLTIPLEIVLIFWMIENFPQATGLYCYLLFIWNVMYKERMENDKNY